MKRLLFLLPILLLAACGGTEQPGGETPTEPTVYDVPTPSFAKGADISWVSEMESTGKTFKKRDGTPADIFDVLKEVGVNSIRLRVWVDPTGGLITLTVAPHAVYTVGPELLVSCAEVTRELGMKLHIHLSETRREVDDCIREHSMTPVRYLDKLGVLGDNVIAAHVVHVDEEEAAILAARGVTISHCPCSNMKLASGVFPYKMLHKAGCRITLGTDGDSSNNNLDMREEMKFAALQAKSSSGDPETMPADEALAMATRAGAEAFGIDAGVIAEGKLADALLIDLQDVQMQPLHNLVSNWVYAASSRCIDTVICNGKVLMTQSR